MNTGNAIALIGMLLLLPACGGSHDTAPEASAPAAEARDAAAPDGTAMTGDGGAPDASAAPSEEDDSAVVADIESILGGDAGEYKAFFLALQEAVAAGDKEAVARMILYPLEGAIDGKRTIRDAGQFVREYDRIVTPAIADALVRQKFAEVMVNQNGIMIGNGQVWLSGICEDDACEKQSILVTTLQDTGDLDS